MSRRGGQLVFDGIASSHHHHHLRAMRLEARLGVGEAAGWVAERGGTLGVSSDRHEHMTGKRRSPKLLSKGAESFLRDNGGGNFLWAG